MTRAATRVPVEVLFPEAPPNYRSDGRRCLPRSLRRPCVWCGERIKQKGTVVKYCSQLCSAKARSGIPLDKNILAARDRGRDAYYQSRIGLVSPQMQRRVDAKNLGLIKYIADQPCCHDHPPERLTSSGKCYECARLAKRSPVNPEKCRQRDHNRRARKANATGSHTVDDVRAIRILQKDRCAGCRVNLKGKGEVDHIVALVRGGSNDRRNLQFLCKSCNSSKHARDAIVFYRQKGFLL
jgi:5-methylcytosine-specific restriction endonuclease McrA